MLGLLWSLRLLFTAIITNTLNRTVKGQVMPLMMIVMILTCCARFGVSPGAVISVTFVKFDPESLVMFRKRSEGKLTTRIARAFLFVVVSIDSPPRYVSHVFFSHGSHPLAEFISGP